MISHVELEGLEKALAEKGLASNKGTGQLMILTSEVNIAHAENMAEVTVMNYMIVDNLSAAENYVNQYMSEHNLESLSFVGFNTHGTNGIAVRVNVPVNENTYNLDVKTRIDVNNLDPKMAKDNSEERQIAADAFMGIIDKVSDGGTFVLIACRVNEEFGPKTLEQANKNMIMYTNSDLTTIEGGIYDFGYGPVSAGSNLAGGSLTSSDDFERGWVKTTSDNGEISSEKLGTSIAIDWDASVYQTMPEKKE